MELIERFLVKLATKVSSSPCCKQTYDELLVALRNIRTLGLPDLLSSNDCFSFSAFWFLQGFIPRDLLTCLMRCSGLSYRSISPIISQTFLKLQHEIYHRLWQPRCKLKIKRDVVKGILPCTLRSYKGPSVQPFHFSTPQVALSLANRPFPPLQTSEWSSLGINWLHSSLV
ncbi:unnamed protein product [Rhizophagus irregularis]|uniref:Uncharacterized protein n=1 Tax=Rhizophagus irregularis TaxID=588596 RepID=A0A2I1GIF0_9GLOM|nr:hypothetical protein RhiirA4_461270 [Rhizophagus irregularis]CAB4432289.1 unnamed protein product [Rhizophagus irregularis]